MVVRSPFTSITYSIKNPEAKSKEKHGVWDPVPEFTIISSYVHSRADFNTYTMGNPMPESTLTLCQSRLSPPVRDFGFGLSLLAGTHSKVIV